MVTSRILSRLSGDDEMSIITATGLRKTFPGAVPVDALKGLDLQIEEGEICRHYGPQRLGKSTLYHSWPCWMIQCGQIICDGTDISRDNRTEDGLPPE